MHESPSRFGGIGDLGPIIKDNKVFRGYLEKQKDITVMPNSQKEWHECLTKRHPRQAEEKVLALVGERIPKRHRKT